MAKARQGRASAITRSRGKTQVETRRHRVCSRMSQKRTIHTTSVQLAQKLEKERYIKLSPDRLRRILKKKGLFRNEREKVIKENKKL